MARDTDGTQVVDVGTYRVVVGGGAKVGRANDVFSLHDPGGTGAECRARFVYNIAHCRVALFG